MFVPKKFAAPHQRSPSSIFTVRVSADAGSAPSASAQSANRAPVVPNRDLLTFICYLAFKIAPCMYRHHFLWWRWGVKGYKVKVVNFNPHSTIRYNTYVKPEK